VHGLGGEQVPLHCRCTSGSSERTARSDRAVKYYSTCSVVSGENRKYGLAAFRDGKECSSGDHGQTLKRGASYNIS